MGENKRRGSVIFAKRFKEDLANSSKAELCEKLELSGETAFRQWANGHTLPTADKLKIISGHFGVSCDYLLGLTDIKSSDIETQAAAKKYGLCEIALKELEAANSLSKLLDAPDERVVNNKYRHMIEALNVLIVYEYEARALARIWRLFYAPVDGVKITEPPLPPPVEWEGKRVNDNSNTGESNIDPSGVEAWRQMNISNALLKVKHCLQHGKENRGNDTK
jgi:transcriptional regulator with XRE-family HTH domain